MKNILQILIASFFSLSIAFAEGMEKEKELSEMIDISDKIEKYGRNFDGFKSFNHMRGIDFFSWQHLGMMIVHYIALIIVVATTVFVARIVWDHAGKCCHKSTK